MLTTLFYVLCGFAVLHFIYERIVLPSIRLHYRNELFKIRDTVRNEMISGVEGKDVEVAKLVHDGLNNTINRLHYLTLGNKVRAQMRFEADESMRNHVKKHVDMMMSSNNETLKGTLDRTVDIMDKVLLFNNLFFFIYTLPLLGIVLTVSLVLSTANKMVKKYRSRLKSKEFEETILLMNDRFVKRAVVPA
ncbi:TPA: hypothetical protein PFA69_002082 [Serratia marcescens]|nr:hypothetical protein [Serratia marcescens]